MSKDDTKKAEPFISNTAVHAWQEFPGHHGGALSKALVRPESCGTRRIDYRISRYAPEAYVADHVHKIQEQIYHVLEGEGCLMLNGRTVLLQRDDYVWIPPGVNHSFTNPRPDPLVFLVITSPVEDDEVPI